MLEAVFDDQLPFEKGARQPLRKKRRQNIAVQMLRCLRQGQCRLPGTSDERRRAWAKRRVVSAGQLDIP